VVEGLCDLFGDLVVGDPADPETEVGPLVSERQRQRVEGYIRSGREEGAKLASGGSRPRIGRGWHVEPTVFSEVDSGMRIAQEEIFGPVVAVLPYDGEDAGIALANDTVYGLAGAVWTSDIDHGIEAARRVRTGMCSINGAFPSWRRLSAGSSRAV
jgi:aldehyde dehydrogenase (NAD+)